MVDGRQVSGSLYYLSDSIRATRRSGNIPARRHGQPPSCLGSGTFPAVPKRVVLQGSAGPTVGDRASLVSVLLRYFAAWSSTFTIVIVGVNVPHFLDSVVIVPLRFARLPAAGAVVLTW